MIKPSRKEKCNVMRTEVSGSIQHKISDVTVAAIYFMNDILKKIIASMTFVTNAEKR